MSHAPLDPRVRLAAAAAAWAVALGAPHPASAASVAALALLLRLLRPRALRALVPPAAIGLLAGALLAAAGSGSGRWLPAATLLARIVAAGWVAGALVAWLPLAELLGALAWARAPASLLELVAIGDRQRHALAERARAVLDAQRLRLGWSGARRALGSAGTLAGLSVWRAVIQAEIAADALALRGARGRQLHALEPRPGWRNAFFALGAGAALWGCLALPGVLPA